MSSNHSEPLNPWTTVSEKEVYDNPWISVSHREVITPGGTDGIYGVVHFKNLAIGIVPIDEQGNTWLVGQWRYTLKQFSWEIPEGGCPLGSDPLETAKRELKEETGMEASEWEKIIDFHTSNSVTDEAGIAFIARGLCHGETELEATESDMQRKQVSFTEALAMIDRGEITDSLSIMALLKADRLLSQQAKGR